MSIGRIFLLQELTASRLVRKFSRIMDIRSQILPLRVIFKLVESSPHFRVAYIATITWSKKWLYSLRFSE